MISMLPACAYIVFFWVKKTHLTDTLFFNAHLKISVGLIILALILLVFVSHKFYQPLAACFSPFLFLALYKICNAISLLINKRPFIWATRHDVKSGDYYTALDVTLSILVICGSIIACLPISILFSKYLN